LGEDSALVRFDTIRRDDGGAAHSALPWVAVIEYRFSGEPMSAADRFVNPLGFQVLRYRRDPEALSSLDQAEPLQAIEQNTAALAPVEADEVQVP